MSSETQMLLWISEGAALHCKDFLLFGFSSYKKKKRGEKKEQSTVLGFYVTAISFQQIFWGEGCDVTIHQIVWPNDHYEKRMYKRSPGHKIQSNCTNSTVGRDAL